MFPAHTVLLQSPCVCACVWAPTPPRYQQIAKATFDVQNKQLYLKQLAAEAAKLQAGGGGTSTAQHPTLPQQPLQQQPHAQQQQEVLSPPGQEQPQPSSQQQQQSSIGAFSAAGGHAAVAGAGGGGMIRVLEGTAQEVYRALLFVVFTLEVYVLSFIPFAGVVIVRL